MLLPVWHAGGEEVAELAVPALPSFRKQPRPDQSVHLEIQEH